MPHESINKTQPNELTRQQQTPQLVLNKHDRNSIFSTLANHLSKPRNFSFALLNGSFLTSRELIAVDFSNELSNYQYASAVTYVIAIGIPTGWTT
jgi:hypothetical protein